MTGTPGIPPTIPYIISTNTKVGQYDRPEAWVLFSTDDAEAISPTWHDATPYVRGFSVSRGRESERGQIGPGTATLTLDNRDRIFDPEYSTVVRNYVGNPNLERGIAGWTVEGTSATIAHDTTKARFGSGSLKITGSTNGQLLAVYSITGLNPTILEQGAVWQASAWFNADQAPGEGLFVGIRETGGATGTEYSGNSQIGEPGPGWDDEWVYWFSEGTIVRDDRTGLDIVLGTFSGAEAGDIYFIDGVRLSLKSVHDQGPFFASAQFFPNGGSYIDGDNGGVWEGTPHNSRTVGLPIRAMNQWWIRVQENSETQDLFKGYADGYPQSWPGAGQSDALVQVTCTDEQKVLNLDRLPTMDPPRDTYADLVAFDAPHGYWQCQPSPLSAVMLVPTIGAAAFGMVGGGGTTFFVASPIVGDASVNLPGVSAPGVGLARKTDTGFTSMIPPFTFDELPIGGEGDMGGLSQFAIETWFWSDEVPGAARNIIRGPLSGGVNTWNMTHTTAGQVSATARNSGGTAFTTTHERVLVPNTWYHLVQVVNGSNVLLFINGVGAASSAGFSGSIGSMDSGEHVRIGTATAEGGNRAWDEVAVYRYALAQARITAHYQAAVLRGFPAQDPGARINAVLDSIGSKAPRNVRPGSRELIPIFQTGQAPLDVIREAETGDAVDAVFFIARDGKVTFLDDGHRSFSPWSSANVVFADQHDGTFHQYEEVVVDHSDAFLANEFTINRSEGTQTTVSDATSKQRYKRRPEVISNLPLTTDSDVSSIATAMLAKYKEPFSRVSQISFTTASYAAVKELFKLDIGYKIRVIRTHPGGGPPIDQQLFIQKITVDAEWGPTPWRVTFGVSPL